LGGGGAAYSLFCPQAASPPAAVKDITRTSAIRLGRAKVITGTLCKWLARTEQ
jgi:hypothetical protein